MIGSPILTFQPLKGRFSLWSSFSPTPNACSEMKELQLCRFSSMVCLLMHRQLLRWKNGGVRARCTVQGKKILDQSSSNSVIQNNDATCTKRFRYVWLVLYNPYFGCLGTLFHSCPAWGSARSSAGTKLSPSGYGDSTAGSSQMPSSISLHLQRLLRTSCCW